MHVSVGDLGPGDPHVPPSDLTMVTRAGLEAQSQRLWLDGDEGED